MSPTTLAASRVLMQIRSDQIGLSLQAPHAMIIEDRELWSWLAMPIFVFDEPDIASELGLPTAFSAP